jgi:hypothetical protein
MRENKRIMIINKCTIPVKGSCRIEPGGHVIIPESQVKYWLALEYLGFVKITSANDPIISGPLKDPHKIISVPERMRSTPQNRMLDKGLNK